MANEKNIKYKVNSNNQVFYFSLGALVQLIKYHLIMIMNFIDLLNVFFLFPYFSKNNPKNKQMSIGKKKFNMDPKKVTWK